jgi:hypothetical protein
MFCGGAGHLTREREGYPLHCFLLREPPCGYLRSATVVSHGLEAVCSFQIQQREAILRAERIGRVKLREQTEWPKRQGGSRSPTHQKPAALTNRPIAHCENCVLIFLGKEGVADILQLLLFFLIHIGEGKIQFVESRDNC